MQRQDYEDLFKLEGDYWWFAGMRAIAAALLDPVCRNGRRLRMLDAGCGTGQNLSWLQRYGDPQSIFGVDYSAVALSFSRQRGQRLLAQASVTALPFVEESFDLVTCFDVICHLPDDGSDELALAEFNRVLKRGGRLYIRVPAYQWLHSTCDVVLGVPHRYSLSELSDKLEQAGFRLERASYANTLLFPVAALIRMLKRINIGNTGSDVKPLSYTQLNSPLRLMLELEARYLKVPAASLPYGLSVICLAEK